jgi:hypothetical protein
MRPKERRHGTVVYGVAHYAAKLTDRDVVEIRDLAGSETQQSIADRYGVRLACINKVINRKSWKHVA